MIVCKILHTCKLHMDRSMHYHTVGMVGGWLLHALNQVVEYNKERKGRREQERVNKMYRSPHYNYTLSQSIEGIHTRSRCHTFFKTHTPNSIIITPCHIHSCYSLVMLRGVVRNAERLYCLFWWAPGGSWGGGAWAEPKTTSEVRVESPSMSKERRNHLVRGCYNDIWCSIYMQHGVV